MQAKSMLAYSVLMVDAQTEKTIGLAEHTAGVEKMNILARNINESYKWQRSSEAMAARYSSVMDKIISFVTVNQTFLNTLLIKINTSNAMLYGRNTKR